MLLVQGVRVDKGAVGGLRLRAIVEDPDDLRGISICLAADASSDGRCRRQTYGNHGQEDVAGSGSLERRNGRVDEGVDGGGGEHEACSEEADNLVIISRRVLLWACLPHTATW